jgi:hypothetical protein
VLDHWAASDFRDPSLGADWDLNGPGISDASGEPTSGYDITNGKTLSDSTPAHTVLEYLLNAEQADVVEINFSGTSRLHDGGKFDQAGTANGDYCTGACCPGRRHHVKPGCESGRHPAEWRGRRRGVCHRHDSQPLLRMAAFDVIRGSLFLSCANFNVGSASFADQQTKLTQVCKLVLGRL